MKNLRRIVLAAPLAFLSTAGLFGVMALTANAGYEHDASLEEHFPVGLMEIHDPDRDCERRAQLRSALADVIRRGQSCTVDADCVLIDGGCRGIPASREAVAEIQSMQQQYKAVLPSLACSYSAMPICPAPGENPAAVCTEYRCSYADMGLPPGLNRGRPSRP